MHHFDEISCLLIGCKISNNAHGYQQLPRKKLEEKYIGCKNLHLESFVLLFVQFIIKDNDIWTTLIFYTTTLQLPILLF